MYTPAGGRHACNTTAPKCRLTGRYLRGRPPSEVTPAGAEQPKGLRSPGPLWEGDLIHQSDGYSGGIWKEFGPDPR